MCCRGYPHFRVVVGTETLSEGWRPRVKKFIDSHFAQAYLHPFDRNHVSMHALGTIAQSVSGPSGNPRSDAEVIVDVGAALVSGRAWVIELPRHGLKSRFITKTDPAAFAPINPRFGTKVDFTFIAKLEGDQWLRGYVPMRKGVVVGASGMTVASGFDLGQWKVEEWNKLNFPPTLIKKIKPFAAPNNFRKDEQGASGCEGRKVGSGTGVDQSGGRLVRRVSVQPKAW